MSQWMVGSMRIAVECVAHALGVAVMWTTLGVKLKLLQTVKLECKTDKTALLHRSFAIMSDGCTNDRR